MNLKIISQIPVIARYWIQWEEYFSVFSSFSVYSTSLFAIKINAKYRSKKNISHMVWEYISVNKAIYFTQWRRGVVDITTAQLHSTKPELSFCTGSNPARGVSEIHDGEDLWQWSRLEIRLNTFRRSTIPQKQFIVIIIKHACNFSRQPSWFSAWSRKPGATLHKIIQSASLLFLLHKRSKIILENVSLLNTVFIVV